MYLYVYMECFIENSKIYYKNITNIMDSVDPYNYPFPTRQQTMYLSTIIKSMLIYSAKNDFKPTQTNYMRDSSFLKRDIDGADPKILIPPQQHATNFSLSTFVEPIPDRAKNIKKVSDPLYRDDIQGARPKANQFRTSRIVDPLKPVYKLPSAAEISIDQGRNFIRDTLQTNDINNKRKTLMGDRGRDILKQPIAGSQPAKLTKLIKAHSNLQVKDINKDGLFESTRNVNPLQPTYKWRQEQGGEPKNYGAIQGTAPKRMHPIQIAPNRPENSCLNIHDIQGTKSNSCFAKSHFLDKRREFRNYMNTSDIEKAQPSTLKKGIETKRATNPLVPNYRFPGHSEVSK